MATKTITANVLIIGGGLGGLALAQGLRNAEPKVSCHVFERDASSAFRSQGYRLRITPDGAAALQKLLPSHLWDTFEATCSPAPVGPGFMIDACTGEKAEWAKMPTPKAGERPLPQFMKGKSYNADRAVLRQVLLRDMDDCISFSKQFADYETHSDGTVTVNFADGTSATGQVLIGADGVRSSLRRQLLPNLRVLDTEGRAVFGKTVWTPELAERMPPQFSEGACMVAESQGRNVRMLVDFMKFDHEAAAKCGAEDLLPPDYVYWVLCFRKDAYVGDETLLHNLTHEPSKRISLQLADSWHKKVQALFENQQDGSSSTLVFLTCTPEEFISQWEGTEGPGEEPGSVTLLSGPVTLLGDAAHPMTPVGAVGANSAFEEAADLCKGLKKVYAESGAWKKLDALMAYQGLMCKRGEVTIKSSIDGGQHFYGLRPVTELKPAEI